MVEVTVASRVSLEQAFDLYQVVGMLQNRSREEWEQEMGRTAFFITASQGERLIGLARVLTSGLMGAGIWDVMVHPDQQGQGIGRQLVKAAVEELIQRKYPDIALHCDHGLESYYRSLGFVRGPWGMHYKGLGQEALPDGFYS